MPSKELIEKVGLIVYSAKRHDSNHEDAAADIISTILAALQKPTEAMIDVVPVPYRCGSDWRQGAKSTYHAMLNASQLVKD